MRSATYLGVKCTGASSLAGMLCVYISISDAVKVGWISAARLVGWRFDELAHFDAEREMFEVLERREGDTGGAFGGAWCT